MFEDNTCYQKTKAEQDKDIWSWWWWLVCHFKQGGQVNFIEEATFDARLRGGKRVIHASIKEGELSGGKNYSLPNGFEEQQGDQCVWSR